jgi:YD repeat-containing protein
MLGDPGGASMDEGGRVIAKSTGQEAPSGKRERQYVYAGETDCLTTRRVPSGMAIMYTYDQERRLIKVELPGWILFLEEGRPRLLLHERRLVLEFPK